MGDRPVPQAHRFGWQRQPDCMPSHGPTTHSNVIGSRFLAITPTTASCSCRRALLLYSWTTSDGLSCLTLKPFSLPANSLAGSDAFLIIMVSTMEMHMIMDTGAV